MESSEANEASSVILKGARVRLRPFAVGDEEALARHANHREVWRGLYDIVPHPYTLERAREWIALCNAPHPDILRHAIEVDGELCGGLALRPCGPVNEDFVELGYWLGHSLWGKGIATEVVRLVCDYAFDTLKANRVEARVYGFNRASARVLEKCGFTLEGKLRRRMVKEGEYTDQLVYGLLSDDPR